MFSIITLEKKFQLFIIELTSNHYSGKLLSIMINLIINTAFIKGILGGHVLRKDLRIRDPFILTDSERDCYFMYGTTDFSSGNNNNTFSVYFSKDLENFDEGKIIVDGSKYAFWGTKDFWAAEVHKFNGKYYLFGTCIADGKHRATQIFVCDTPDGEFVPLTKDPITPTDWECLDGTLFVEDGTPYLVFCHEWVQIKNGAICALELSKDLKSPVGEPFVLFNAHDNPCVTELAKGSGDYVTDGPFLWQENGKINLIWSSFCGDKYAVLLAQADTLHSKWTHYDNFFEFDGGHAMVFKTLSGERKIALHAPNLGGKERANFLDFEIKKI